MDDNHYPFALAPIPRFGLIEAFPGHAGSDQRADDDPVGGSGDHGSRPGDGRDQMLELSGADYLLEPQDVPAWLELFVPGVDTVTLNLDEAPQDLGEADLEGGGSALVSGDKILLAFPALDRLPIEEISIIVGEDGEACGIAPTPEKCMAEKPEADPDLATLPQTEPDPDLVTEPEPKTDSEDSGSSDEQGGETFSVARSNHGPDRAVDIIEGFEPEAGDVLRITVPANYAGAMKVTFEAPATNGEPHVQVLLDGALVAEVVGGAALDRNSVEVVRSAG